VGLAVAPQSQHRELARDQHRQRPAREQIEAPADDHAGYHQQAVGDGIQQRAQAAVLARDARGDAIGVVAPADDREERSRERVDAIFA